jgi:hypothetical protein
VPFTLGKHHGDQPVLIATAGTPARSIRPGLGNGAYDSHSKIGPQVTFGVAHLPFHNARARNARTKLAAYLAGCGIAINVAQSPYFREFCQSLNAANSAPDWTMVRKFDIPRLYQDVKSKVASYWSSVSVRLFQTSWCDPAVRSYVGSLAGAVRLTVLALLALQPLAVCHTGDRIPDRSNWDLQRRINILGLREGARGREDCFLCPIVRL